MPIVSMIKSPDNIPMSAKIIVEVKVDKPINGSHSYIDPASV
jgi:hypothetical protein